MSRSQSSRSSVHPDAAPPAEGERFARGLLAAAIFTLGLAACGEAVDDPTGTVPADPDTTETRPLNDPAPPVTPVQ